MRADYRTRRSRPAATGPFRRILAKALSAVARRLAAIAARVSRPRGAGKISRPVVIHNMAKVGSKTLMLSLQAYDPGAEVHQTHNLTPSGLFLAEEKMAQLPAPFWAHIDQSRQLGRRIRLERDGPRWAVISLVRDPVARDVSYFFQCLPLLRPDAEAAFTSGSLTITGLVDIFLEHLDDDAALHFVGRPSTWFDLEVKPTFGIDVYAQPFPKERGYQTYAGPNADLLLLRLESLEQCVHPALEHFLGIRDFVLLSDNTATQRQVRPGLSYYALYDEFCARVRFPADYLDEAYSSKLATHFYTDAELRVFRQRWLSMDLGSPPADNPDPSSVQ
jgi:hypothetical protein